MALPALVPNLVIQTQIEPQSVTHVLYTPQGTCAQVAQEAEA